MKIGSFVFIFLCCWCNVNAQETSDIVVVLPGSKVTLNAASEGAVSYQWFLDGEELSGAVGATYIAMQQGKYTVISRNDEGCDSTISNTVEIRFSGRSSPPSGAGEQYFCHFNDPVIADIEVIGAHITWYDEEEGEAFWRKQHCSKTEARIMLHRLRKDLLRKVKKDWQ